jgi:hypothetical protein
MHHLYIGPENNIKRKRIKRQTKNSHHPIDGVDGGLKRLHVLGGSGFGLRREGDTR